MVAFVQSLVCTISSSTHAFRLSALSTPARRVLGSGNGGKGHDHRFVIMSFCDLLPGGKREKLMETVYRAQQGLLNVKRSRGKKTQVTYRRHNRGAIKNRKQSDRTFCSIRRCVCVAVYKVYIKLSIAHSCTFSLNLKNPFMMQRTL